MLTALDLKLLFTIQQKPSTQKAKICRSVNGKPELYCSLKTCYANPRKQRHHKEGNPNFRLSPPECQHSKGCVWNHLKKLEEAGLITVVREKKFDGKNNRGWDWMKVSYSTLGICFGGDLA